MPDNLDTLSDEELINMANQSDDGLDNLSDDDLLAMANDKKQEPEGTRGGIFGKVSESDYQSGKRNILGDIFERPGAAVRASIQAPFGKKIEAYQKASVNPTGVPKFQDLAIEKAQQSTSPTVNALMGMPASAAGLVADTITNPADVLTGFLGASKPAKDAFSSISKTQPGQAIGRFMNKPRNVSDIVKPILDKAPKIMNDNWVVGQAKAGQTVTEGIDDALHNSYNRIYKDVQNTFIDPKEIDSILLDSLDDAGLADVQRSMMSAFGSDRVDTVQKAHFLNQILSKRTPTSLYKPSVSQGKGGQANVKIRQIGTKRAVKDIISNSIDQVDPQAAVQLKELDKFASEKIYPTLEKMRGIFGEGEIPKTEGIMSVYPLRALGTASQRKTIKDIPGLSKEMKKYISDDYANDLKELEKNSMELLKKMKSFRRRQLMKGAGALYLLNKGREQIFGN